MAPKRATTTTPRMRSTPGRRKDDYLAFNARPKEVGSPFNHYPTPDPTSPPPPATPASHGFQTRSRTGIAMPKDVPVDEDGMEDADAFFHSDSVDPSSDPKSFTTPRARRVPQRGTAQPGSSSSGRPSTLRGTRRSGRFSHLAPDADGEALADDDLLDDVPDSTPPQPVFQSSPNPPPSVPIPRRGMLPPPSPLALFDDIPSPSTRAGKRKSMGSTLTASNAQRTGAGSSRLLPAAELDDDTGMEPDQSGEMSIEQSPRSSKASRKNNRSHEDDRAASAELEVVGHEDEEEEETTQPVRRAGSKRSAPAHETPEPESDGDQGHDDGVPDTYQSEDDAVEPMDYANGVDYSDDGGSADLERDAIEAENQSGENSDEEREPAPQRKRGRPPRQGSAPHTLPKPKRTRVSQIGVDDAAYQGDFVTRSGRQHFRPLRYWENERFEYTPGPESSIISQVVHVPPPEPAPKKKGRGRPPRPKAQVLRPPTPDEDPEEDMDKNTNLTAVVQIYPTETEVNRRVVIPRSKLAPKWVLDRKFKYQKALGDGKFIASGVVYIPIDGEKPAKPSKDNAYVFYVIDGLVQVHIHQTSFICATGGQFLIPRGNTYEIKNISKTKEAKLFFAQSRKIRATEESDGPDDETEEDAHNGTGLASQPPQESESEGDAESPAPPTPPPVKRKPGRPRKS